MALIQVNYLSRALFRTVPLHVVLPSDKVTVDRSAYCIPDGYRYKTLYLMHGLVGNYTGWITNTRIQRWAEEKNLAVVMPSGDNSFYINGPTANSDYGDFIGRELVEFTRRTFPLSERREDTFIGGLSMGGFGALRNGLKYSETFSHIIELSGALQILNEDPDLVSGENQVFGDLEQARRSDKNPFVAMQDLIAEHREKPRIFMACGLEDSLLEENRHWRDILREHGFDVSYYEGPGAHTWDFWDAQIKPFLEWLPLDDADSGLGDGNVKAR